jgi:hypothetical protein
VRYRLHLDVTGQRLYLPQHLRVVGIPNTVMHVYDLSQGLCRKKITAYNSNARWRFWCCARRGSQRSAAAIKGKATARDPILVDITSFEFNHSNTATLLIYLPRTFTKATLKYSTAISSAKSANTLGSMESTQQTPRIVQLAATIGDAVNKLNEFLTSHGIQTPSFDEGAPTTLPGEVADLQSEVLEATLELHDLLLAPMTLLIMKTAVEISSLTLSEIRMSS